LVTGFRRHHIDPSAIARENGILGNLGDTAWFALAMALLARWLPVELVGGGHFIRETLLGISFFSLVTQQVHAFAHHPRPPAWVSSLQRWRVIIPPHVHARHHRAGHDTHYAVLTGWTNGIVDRVRLAEWLAPR
jgi:hypothetical protein